jgi:hypothetical protein
MASTVLSRTQANGTSSRIFTASIWFKRSPVTNVGNQPIWSSSSSTGDALDLLLAGNGEINFEDVNGNAPKFVTTRKLRDPSAWYHVVVAVDSTQATDTNRVKIYLNGVQETVFGTANYPTQNMDFAISTSADTMKFGSGGQGPSNYFNGLMSYVAFVDGTAYDASYFGEVDSASGIWKINTSPSVTYGTNGCFLKMDTSSPGSDTSGNDNTFTASGTPTLAQDNASNNFTTLNPLNAYYTNSTFSNGNTTFASGSSYSGTTANILLSTGKWYWEGKPISKDGDGDNYVFGIQGQEATGTNQFVGSQAFGWMYYGASGQLYNNNSGASYGDTFTAGDIIGVALDCTNNKLYFSKNGVFQNSENPSAGTGGISITAPASVSLGGYYPSQTFWTGNSGTFSMNFGNGFFGVTAVASSNADAAGHGLFEYAVPTGYFTLNTKNLNTYGG